MATIAGTGTKTMLQNLRQKLLLRRIESGCTHHFSLRMQHVTSTNINTKPFSTNPASWTAASVLSHQKHPPNAATKTASASSNTTTPWTLDDDKMLATFRRKKKDLAQIGIYMPHQPLETIEAKIAEYDARSSQKPTFQRWTSKEDKLLAEAARKLGDRWAEISETYFMPPVPVPDANDTNLGSSPSGTRGSTTTSKTRRSPRSCQIRWKFLNADMASNDFSNFSTRSSPVGAGGYRQGAWSEDEIELFQELVNPNTSLAGANDWEAISQAMGTRSAIQCHSQFKTVLHTGTKGKWTLAEISKLKEAVDLYGRDWQMVSKHVGTRAPGQVRQKWNQLSDKAVERLEQREASMK
ncbi:Myblike DNAbinding domain-containing protein [Mortierella antarctica]|nr:Myblike DNAbinding domain-containing protein [Mortierella antarctica]